MGKETSTKAKDIVPQGEVVELTEYEKEYEEVRKLFEKGKFTGDDGAVHKGADLLRKVLTEILMINHMFLSQNGEEVQKKITLAGSTKELETLDLRVICDIFDDNQIKLFESAGGAYLENEYLLSSISFNNLAQFIDSVKQKDNESDYVKLGAQQLLNSIIILLHSHKKLKITEYHLLANFTHMTDEIKKIRSSHSKLEGVISKLSYLKEEKEEVAIRPFEWYKLKGMLINESDGSRNIAFKVETFVNILTAIFLGIVKNKNIKTTGSKDLTKVAKEIIFTSGYNSGTAFGWTMNEIIQKSENPLTIEDKIKKWCDFDSDVGFGLLSLYTPKNTSVQEDFEKEGHTFTKYNIHIKLSDNFVVHKRDTKDINLCTFIAGYIKGVLEKITGQPMEIQHNPNECQQFGTLDCCIFQVKTKEDELVSNFLEASQKYSDSNIEQIEDINTDKRGRHEGF